MKAAITTITEEERVQRRERLTQELFGMTGEQFCDAVSAGEVGGLDHDALMELLIFYPELD